MSKAFVQMSRSWERHRHIDFNEALVPFPGCEPEGWCLCLKEHCRVAMDNDSDNDHSFNQLHVHKALTGTFLVGKRNSLNAKKKL